MSGDVEKGPFVDNPLRQLVVEEEHYWCLFAPACIGRGSCIRDTTMTFNRLGQPAMQLLTRLVGIAGRSGNLERGCFGTKICGRSV
jgi:hypothetical protein